ncbi:anthranilate synthase component I family protein [Acetobacter cerevisiae]|uniref:anthranilate synthase component I family protein n=1 Tax=Acetobacter cerevisiae TaxID=178900 RepID=UPI0020A03796|nr:anthranilate synthase component I family protein [Acetobacter cerevisiae]MCP1269570.1 anthranilate synthase component I family protein [Acetobacter cerevisiae]MCP1277524.1 anthranilate synthase component I family protein [Acetobacter cerevisiae]
MVTARVWVKELAWREPEAVFAAWGDAPWCAFLDSGGPVEGRSRWQIFCRTPCQILVVQGGQIFQNAEPPVPFTPDALFARLRQAMPSAVVRADEPEGMPELPFSGGWIGFAGYGLGQQLEHIAPRHSAQDEPDWASGFYDHAFVWDRLSKRAFIAGVVLEGDQDTAGGQSVGEHITAWEAVPEGVVTLPDVPRVQFRLDQSRVSYCEAIECAKAYIAAGDIFQVNITGRYSSAFPKEFSNTALYLALRQKAPAPFGAYLSCGAGYALHSTSPERFLQCDAQGVVTSRPIKGTAPRGQTPEEDDVFAAALSADDKERAENLMIVDLMRHDIGRVARVGSMSVPEFLRVERFAHVHHLVSEVRGELAAGRDVFDLLRATLPPGSVTGAPKHRAMEIIEELEASPRGAYCGSVLCVGVDGRLESSVIIRTLVRRTDSLTLAAGGGITILSDAQKEYEEMRLKLAPFRALFGDEA